MRLVKVRSQRGLAIVLENTLDYVRENWYKELRIIKRNENYVDRSVPA